jgi:hypothetical protein
MLHPLATIQSELATAKSPGFWPEQAGFIYCDWYLSQVTVNEDGLQTGRWSTGWG